MGTSESHEALEPPRRRVSEKGSSLSLPSASRLYRERGRGSSCCFFSAIVFPARAIALHVEGCCNSASLSCRRTTRPKLCMANKDMTAPNDFILVRGKNRKGWLELTVQCDPTGNS